MKRGIAPLNRFRIGVLSIPSTGRYWLNPAARARKAGPAGTFNTLYGSFLVEAQCDDTILSPAGTFNTLYGSFLVEAGFVDTDQATKPYLSIPSTGRSWLKPRTSGHRSDWRCRLSIPSTGRSWLKRRILASKAAGNQPFNTLYGSFLVEALWQQFYDPAGKIAFQYPLRVVPG